MKNFKNSKTAKFVSGFVGLSVAAMMMGPSLASAATVEELTAQINALLAQVSALQATTGNSTATPAACAYTFAQTLKMGVSSDEVMNLQKVLNMSADTQVSATGVGSKGMETKYFGAMTKAAVIKFQEKYASDILTPNGLTKGTGLVGASSRAKLNAMCSSTPTTPTTPTSTSTVSGAVSATLDMSSPMGVVVIPGSTMKSAIFKIANNGATAVKVTSVKLQRTGVSSDSIIRNAYLYNGATRITDSATVSSGMLNFSDTAGIVSIPAGTNVLLAVTVEVDTTAGVGQTIGFNLTEVNTDAGMVSGLPISGAQGSVIAAPSDMASVTFGATTEPQTPGNIDPQTDFVAWRNNINIGSRDVSLSSLRFRQVGSVAQGDLQNFRLYVGGTQVGGAVAQVGSDGYVVFDFTAAPIVVKAGTREFKVLVDIVGGSSRTFGLALQQAADVTFKDGQLNVVIPATITTTGPGTATILSGDLTITKSTDSTSGNVINNGSGVTLAKFDFKSTGEKLKVENLTIGFTTSDGSLTKLRNVAIFANGVQVGSTQTLLLAGTQYNIGSSLVLMPGVVTPVEVRGDIFDNDGTNNASSGDTLQVQINAGTSNVYKMVSYGYIGRPGVAVLGNSLTVTDGSLTVAKYSAYANQTVTVPQTAYKVGEFRVTTGSTEGVSLSSFNVDVDGGTVTATNLSNMYVVYGSKTSSVKSTVTSTGNNFSINEIVPANSSLSVAVYATLSSAITNGQTLRADLTVSGSSQNAGNALTPAEVQGQTIAIGAGVLTVVADASTPVSSLVVGNSMPKVGSYKFTGLNDAFTIDELTFQVNSVGAAAIKNIVVKDGATTLATTPIDASNKATSTGLTLAVPYNSNKIIDVYADLGTIGTGGATTSANVGVTLVSHEYMTSDGVKTRVYGSTSTNPFYAFKTKPTITNVALPTTVLAAGTQTVAQFTITADAGGTVAWKRLQLAVNASGVGFSTVSFYDAANQSTALVGTVSTTSSSITFVPTNEQEVSGSKTYVVKAFITGSPTTGNSFATNIPALGGFVAPNVFGTVSTTNAFIWSDESLIGHSETTADWMGDYLVKNLPTDSQTLTK